MTKLDLSFGYPATFEDGVPMSIRHSCFVILYTFAIRH